MHQGHTMVSRTRESLLKEVEELFDLTQYRVDTNTQKLFEIKITRNQVEWTLEYYYELATWRATINFQIDWDGSTRPSLQEAVGIARATALLGLQNTIENINKSTKLL